MVFCGYISPKPLWWGRIIEKLESRLFILKSKSGTSQKPSSSSADVVPVNFFRKLLNASVRQQQHCETKCVQNMFSQGGGLRMQGRTFTLTLSTCSKRLCTASEWVCGHCALWMFASWVLIQASLLLTRWLCVCVCVFICVCVREGDVSSIFNCSHVSVNVKGHAWFSSPACARMKHNHWPEHTNKRSWVSLVNCIRVTWERRIQFCFFKLTQLVVVCFCTDSLQIPWINKTLRRLNSLQTSVISYSHTMWLQNKHSDVRLSKKPPPRDAHNKHKTSQRHSALHICKMEGKIEGGGQGFEQASKKAFSSFLGVDVRLKLRGKLSLRSLRWREGKNSTLIP